MSTVVVSGGYPPFERIIDDILSAIPGNSPAAEEIARLAAVGAVAGALLASNNLSDVADVATARANLGLAIGSAVQAYSARLAAIAGLSLAQGDVLYWDGGTFQKLPAGTDGQFLRTRGTGANPDWANVAGGGDLLSTNNLSDVANTASARTNLGVAIGSNVQAYSALLAALAGLTSAADTLPYFTGSNAAATTALSSFIRTLLDDADAATARATLGLTLGTNVQAYSALLAALAGLTSAADRLPYFTGSNAAALATFTAFARTLMDDADAATARTTLGVAIGTDVAPFTNPLNSVSAAKTFALGEANQRFLHPSADTTARTWTIDSNANVAFPVGTMLGFINQNGAGAITIAITSDTMRLAGAGTTGSRTLAANGVAVAQKLTSTEWIISGTNLT